MNEGLPFAQILVQNENRGFYLTQAVRWASRRSAFVVHEETKQGLNSLACIASIAPWVGVLGTVVGIPSSFVGCSGEKSACLAAVAERLSGSIWPTAMGLMVGLASLWCYRYLAGRLETFDSEMENESLALVNQLLAFRGRWELEHANNVTADSHMFGEKSLAGRRQEPRRELRSILLTGAALVVAWSLEVVRYFEHDSLPLDSAEWRACVYVLFTLGISCVPAFAVWVKIQDRKAGGFVVLASVLCLGWCIVELVLRVHLL